MQITSQATIEKHCALYCRRRTNRDKLAPARVTCWSARSQPRAVTVVEADSHGARVLLPFKACIGEMVRVSFADNLNQHQTRRARVCWVHRLESANRLMVGLAFDEEMRAA